MKSIYDFYLKNSNFIDIVIIMLFILLVSSIIRWRKLYVKLVQTSKEEKNITLSLRKILDTIPDPVFCKNAEGLYSECNKEFEKALGLKREEIIGKSVFELTKDTEQANIYYNADLDLMNKKGIQIYETKFKLHDGTIWDAVYRKAAILSDNGELLGLVGVIINITEVKKNQKKIEKMLKIQEVFIEINQSMIDFNNVKDFLNLILEKVISIIDGAKHGNIFEFDKNSTLKLVAYNNYNLKNAEEFSMPLSQSLIWEVTEGDIKDIVKIDDVYKLNYIINEVVDSTKNTKTRSIISAPIIIDNNLYGILNIYSDIADAFSAEDLEIMKYIKVQIEMAVSKNILYEEKIYLSRYDGLTNLYNRRYFEEVCSNIFLTDEKNETTFSIVIFDLNDLKSINDNYGHIVGDEYIKTFSNELKNIANDSDIVARYGGDEFIGVFFYDDFEKLKEVFEGILKKLSTIPVNNESAVFCRFSFGIATYPEDGKEYDRLVSVADKRMYEYKREYKIK